MTLDRLDRLINWFLAGCIAVAAGILIGSIIAAVIIEPPIRQVLRNQAAMASALSAILQKQ